MAGLNICRVRQHVALVAGALLVCLGSFAAAQDSASEPESNYNWELATLGGSQFWTDVRVDGGWRIQKNTYFGHYRLLDNADVRKAWGSKQACATELEKRLAANEFEPYKGRVVILLHGLCRTWKSMQPMAEHLKAEGYEVILFRYASSREQVGDHAQNLKRVISELPADVTEINFVAHSLGNIVVRHYVSNCEKSQSLSLDNRINRMVMIGPPNQGSQMARLLKDSVAFKLIAGASGAQLSIGWEELKENLATPKFEFGIVAGGYGVEGARFNNILLSGPDDFTVSKKEAMLAGASDFLVKPLLHSTMMHQSEVMESTSRFLKNGYFVSKEKIQPIKSLPSSTKPKPSSE